MNGIIYVSGIMPKVEQLCAFCEQPLGEIEFTGGFCLRCDNGNCRLFAQCQGIRNRTGEEGEAYRQNRKASSMFVVIMGGGRRRKELSPESRSDMDRRKARPGYQGWMEQKKQNYRTLRDLGYTCQEALNNSSNKRMRELELKEKVPKRKKRRD